MLRIEICVYFYHIGTLYIFRFFSPIRSMGSMSEIYYGDTTHSVHARTLTKQGMFSFE